MKTIFATLLILALSASLLLLGCASQSIDVPPAPPYVPSGSSSPAPAAIAPSAPSSAAPSTPSGVNPAAPSSPTPTSCSSLGGNARVDCFVGQARTQKDVTVCTSLTSQEDRNSCIARWCASEARDFKQCDRLTNNDDRLGCLNKCNPNANT